MLTLRLIRVLKLTFYKYFPIVQTRMDRLNRNELESDSNPMKSAHEHEHTLTAHIIKL